MRETFNINNLEQGAMMVKVQAPPEKLLALGIAVHDHIIVGRDGHASLKGLKLI